MTVDPAAVSEAILDVMDIARPDADRDTLGRVILRVVRAEASTPPAPPKVPAIFQEVRGKSAVGAEASDRKAGDAPDPEEGPRRSSERPSAPTVQPKKRTGGRQAPKDPACPFGCGRTFDHAPAKARHMKLCPNRPRVEEARAEIALAGLVDNDDRVTINDDDPPETPAAELGYYWCATHKRVETRATAEVGCSWNGPYATPEQARAFRE